MDGVTATSISMTWEPPDEGDINGILDEYQLTYVGRDLDTNLHDIRFDTNLKLLQQTELTDLQENTSYTIQVFLFSSGARSPPATIVVSTLQSGNYKLLLLI